jgi:hypothetical protein
MHVLHIMAALLMMLSHLLLIILMFFQGITILIFH